MNSRFNLLHKLIDGHPLGPVIESVKPVDAISRPDPVEDPSQLERIFPLAQIFAD